MQLREIMRTDVETLAPNMPLREAARRMSRQNASVLPVCERGKVVGVLTLRDLTMRATAQRRDPLGCAVREVMTRQFVHGRAHQNTMEAAGIMRGRQLSELLVLDEDGRLAGMVSLGDLARIGRESDHPESGLAKRSKLVAR